MFLLLYTTFLMNGLKCLLNATGHVKTWLFLWAVCNRDMLVKAGVCVLSSPDVFGLKVRWGVTDCADAWRSPASVGLKRQQRIRA